jgi:two-component system response regulator MprA
VAVLDDDIRFIRRVERVLNQEDVGVCAVTTMDLDEAVRVIGGSECNMVLVDIFMYGSAAGFDLIERLRSAEATARLPIIVTSGARREIGKRVTFLQENNCDVLLKPFAPQDLVARVLAPEGSAEGEYARASNKPLRFPSPVQARQSA